MICAEILDAVKYYSSRLEGMEAQATLCCTQKPTSLPHHLSGTVVRHSVEGQLQPSFLGFGPLSHPEHRAHPELVKAPPQRKNQLLRLRVKFPENPNQANLRERECHRKGLALGTA